MGQIDSKILPFAKSGEFGGIQIPHANTGVPLAFVAAKALGFSSMLLSCMAFLMAWTGCHAVNRPPPW